MVAIQLILVKDYVNEGMLVLSFCIKGFPNDDGRYLQC